MKEVSRQTQQDNMVMVAGEITTQAKLDYEKAGQSLELRACCTELAFESNKGCMMLDDG